MPRWGCSVAVIVASLLILSTPQLARADEEIPADPSQRLTDDPPLPGGLNCAMTYTRRNVAFEWFDTSDAWHNDQVADSDIDVFTMPFSFIYFGMRRGWVGIADDGWISFFEPENGNWDPFPDPIPDMGPPYGVIAPMWVDFDPEEGFTVPDQRVIELKTFGSAPYRVFVITWVRFPRFGVPDTEYTFQVALYETTNIIRFQYLEIIEHWRDPNAAMSIGIESELGDVGYQFAHNSDIDMEGRAMEYVPNLPAPDCGSATELNCGDTLTDELTGTVNELVLHGCSDEVFLANERVYSFTLDSVSLVELNVTPTEPGRDLRLFLMSGCDMCNCWAGDTDRIRTVLGPGEYTLMVDGPTAADNGAYDLSFECQVLMTGPTGQIMNTSPPCDLSLWFDRYANGRGVFTVNGWFTWWEDFTYHALRTDGSQIYGTNWERSSCISFTEMNSWVDDNTDKAVVYFRTPDADILQTVYGREHDGCCGVLLVTKVINRDGSNHYYEYRSLYGMDFGPPELICLATEDRVLSGPLHVEPEPGDYALEQDLTCDDSTVPPGRCALTCSQPAELKTADTLELKVVAQYLSDASANVVQSEWVNYHDVNTICDDLDPDPWTGGFLPTPEAIADCGNHGALLYSTRIPGNGQLAPGESDTLVQAFGDGCRINPDCSTCVATADLVVGATELCLGYTALLDASGSEAIGCEAGSGTTTYEWLRDGVPTTETGVTYIVNEPTAGDHTYTVNLSCQPPPQGLECADSREVAIPTHDCAACNIDAQIDSLGNTVCIGGTMLLDASVSAITECPGTLEYSWTRDGIELPGEESPQLIIEEPAPGNHNYQVDIVCNPPPVGLSCQGSTNTTISAVDCSACSITAAIYAPTTELSVGQPTTLDALRDTVIDQCPGTVTYTWFRDGEELLGETSSTLNVLETEAGEYHFEVIVTCSPPPMGLDCWSRSPITILTYTAGPVPDLGNTLKAVKSRSDGTKVVLEWGQGIPDLTYELLRVETKPELAPPQAEPPYQQGITNLWYEDAGAVVTPVPYFYRVRGSNLGGQKGPY